MLARSTPVGRSLSDQRERESRENGKGQNITQLVLQKPTAFKEATCITQLVLQKPTAFKESTYTQLVLEKPTAFKESTYITQLVLPLR